MTVRTYSRTDLIDPLPGQHFIDGKWRKSADGRTFETIDPSTEAVLAIERNSVSGSTTILRFVKRPTCASADSAASTVLTSQSLRRASSTR